MGVHTFVTVISVTINLYLVRSSSPRSLPTIIFNNNNTSFSLVILFDKLVRTDEKERKVRLYIVLRGSEGDLLGVGRGAIHKRGK